MWNALEGSPGVTGGGTVSSLSTASMDPASLWMNTQLASALSLTGDAQYWEESISPTTIRQELAAADPSNSASTHVILRGMKWLLASISKGRNVSDFYPHVVKLVGAVSLEVRKMVYMYLVQYANHNAETRELSLLSINAFQRGLADAEQWIRALALRVLTSINIPDILQIQIMGVQKCAQDRSPYVRKCAANALSKLYVRCEAGDEQQKLLLSICHDLLLYDQATMVLTSALIAWQELCPQRLDMLHGCFRKFCHLLTDMDEWGQVVVLEVFARYCRQYFAEPAGWRDGSAERIDCSRRVRRTIYGLESEVVLPDDEQRTTTSTWGNQNMLSTADQAAMAGVTLPPRNLGPKKVKRRVKKAAFYSDEEDESTEEEVYAESATGRSLPVANAMRQRNILGLPPSSSSHSNNNSAGGNVFVPRALRPASAAAVGTSKMNDPEEEDLAEDHRLFLNAAMHLLKSRNAGVVMAVCSLHYYCGVSSIKVRTAMGKALVRIHRDLREVQYVVLRSIHTLASECPSAFVPFLPDFFVKASLDPPFTRLIKLDILTSLALEPAAIDAVLKELRSYVRHGDLTFAKAAISAVGRVVELARIVCDRHGQKQGSPEHERAQANQIALDALHGLLTLTQAPHNIRAVTGQAVIVMHLILQLLQQDCNGGMAVSDPNRVQVRSIQRILLLLMKTLTVRAARAETKDAGGDDDVDDDDDDDEEEQSRSSPLDGVVTVALPGEAAATAIWVVGEHLAEFSLSPTLKPFEDSTRSGIRLELIRMLVKAFPEMSLAEKEQGIHLASKLIVSRKAGGTIHALAGEGALCEQVLAMGRVDVNPDVRDRARFESLLLRSVSALEHDFDGMDDNISLVDSKSLTLGHVTRLLLSKKPACSSLPVENHSNTHALESDGFRFGTLSSLVGHRARSAYITFPPWASEDSPSSLRDPPTEKPKPTMTPQPQTNLPSTPSHAYSDDQPAARKQNSRGFYGGEASSTDGSSSSSSSSDGDDDDDSSSSSSSNSDDDDSSSDDSRAKPAVPGALPTLTNTAQTSTQAKVQTVADSDDSSDDDSDSDDSSDDGGTPKKAAPPVTSNLISTTTTVSASLTANQHFQHNGSAPSSSSVVDDMRGLVLTPMMSDAGEEDQNPDTERDSSEWIQLVRPEHSGGLSVMARYLQGPTKAREAQLLGLKLESPTLVFLQILLEGQTSAAASFRRIKWQPKSSTSAATGSSILPKKIYFPPEIGELKPGQRVEYVLGLDFASASDRDGSSVARLDFKFGHGTIPIEIKPLIGNLLLPCKRTASEFEDEIKPLQGFQRVESGITTTTVMNEGTLKRAILKSATLTACTGQKKETGILRFVGTLPESGGLVYVKVVASVGGDSSSSSFKVIVCSEITLAANSIMNGLKKILAKQNL